MPRYSDQWLIDRTMFDYVQGGSCACCVGFLFMPNGTKGLIETMSELDTDSKEAEISALDRLPWPVEMKDQVWMERVRLRQYLKRTMSIYKDFWNCHQRQFEAWFMDLPKSELARYFQLPRTEPIERLQQQQQQQQQVRRSQPPKAFNIHPAFGTVLCAVTEQIANFEMTQYDVDGCGPSEVGFEQILTFHYRGGFTLVDDTVATKRKWLQRHRTLGGPKLLERHHHYHHHTVGNVKSKKGRDTEDSSSDDDEEEIDTDADGAGAEGAERDKKINNDTHTVPSFRSDRRIMRLLIARCFADTLQSAFLRSMDQQRLETERDDDICDTR